MSELNIVPDTQQSLFWYPELKYKYDFEKGIDKPLAMRAYIGYFLDRLQSMFIWSGLPETIPQKWLESYLLVDGHCAVINTEKGLFATNGGMGADPNEYYIPTKFIVSNPYLPEGSSAGRNYTIDGDNQDAVFVRNDTYTVGLMPLLVKYCSQMVENDITMSIADIWVRATVALSAADDQTRESAEQWLRDLRKGKLGVIGEAPFLAGNQNESLRTNPIGTVAGTLTDLIEYHQYLKAGLYNDIGLNSNYNMKREAIMSNETKLNDDALHPLIDTMLACRKEAAEEINKLFGTNISVEFNSAWADNEKENEAVMEQIEAAAESTDEVSDEAEAHVEVSDQTDEVIEDDTTTDETVDKTVEDEAEAPVETESIIEAIETAAEVIADAIEGDTTEDTEGGAE